MLLSAGVYLAGMRGASMRILCMADRLLLGQQGHLFPWAPVCLAIGIGGYFLLPFEPAVMVHVVALGIGALCLGVALVRPGGLAALGWVVALVAAGFCLAGARTHRQAAPVIGWHYYGPVEGRVVGLDRSASDVPRVTLDQVRLRRTSPERLPERVRISLHGPDAELRAGQRIMTTASLSPPMGPTEPGGFDFRLDAWFKRLGAIGYARGPVVTVAPPEANTLSLRIFALRRILSERIITVLPGDVGGFATAVTTGDRSTLGQGAVEALRASNLAHLLAISGLHMGLLVGFVFAALRLLLSLVPPLALRLPVKKAAALGAMAAASFYLALSGANVATERAFVMAMVALGAVLIDRRAISLRSVAIAALIVLVMRPEALLGPGFQMSFAATTALVAVFGWLRDAPWRALSGWKHQLFTLVVSSTVASLATAPIGAAHFNTLSHYGLIANLLSVPLMGVLVMPAAVVALLLSPLGLESLALSVMGWGLRWILLVAHWVAGFDHAQGHVLRPMGAVLPMLALGSLWVMLWQGRGRLFGVIPAVAALFFWAGSPRPMVLISDSGSLVGVMTGTGRALSKERGAGFEARNWLAGDGDGADQPHAAARWPVAGDPGGAAADPADQKGVRIIETKAGVIAHVIGKRGAGAFGGCPVPMLVVTSVPMEPRAGCDIYDPPRLRRTGSIALSPDGRMRTAREAAGRRPWSDPPRRRGQ